jgi:hypothetical protein
MHDCREEVGHRPWDEPQRDDDEDLFAGTLELVGDG